MRHPDVVEELRAMVSATPAEGYASCCEAIGRMDLRRALAHITAPTLVVSAEDDRAIPPEHGARIADAVRGARYTVLRRAAHVPIVERPDDIASLLSDHLVS